VAKKIATKTIKHKISPDIWFYFSEHQNQGLTDSECSADCLPFTNLPFIINKQSEGWFRRALIPLMLLRSNEFKVNVLQCHYS